MYCEDPRFTFSLESIYFPQKGRKIYISAYKDFSNHYNNFFLFIFFPQEFPF